MEPLINKLITLLTVSCERYDRTYYFRIHCSVSYPKYLLFYSFYLSDTASMSWQEVSKQLVSLSCGQLLLSDRFGGEIGFDIKSVSLALPLDMSTVPLTHIIAHWHQLDLNEGTQIRSKQRKYEMWPFMDWEYVCVHLIGIDWTLAQFGFCGHNIYSVEN